MNALRTLTCLIAVTLAPVALAPLSALSQTSTPQISASQTQAILAVLNKSADDWNRGDLKTFATSYKNSPDILFIGSTIQHGYAEMLTRYKTVFPTPAKMGKLTFSQLKTQPLDEHFATVTGHFHLQRTSAGGGNAGGYFLLVMEKTPGGWKIVRDDTVSLPSSGN